MIFHLSFEIPKKPELSFDETVPVLNAAELDIIKKQIRDNSRVIDEYVDKIHLFVNQEKYPRSEPFVERLRERMFLLMEENDTFRSVLWNHYQLEQTRFSPRSRAPKMRRAR
ncbi:MAG: hypothetical protein HY714_02335 [Candidatus Omnitrophica bacterium]|nr:hypothetical protein [Candidatus Omnitrophota bacterium]